MASGLQWPGEGASTPGIGTVAPGSLGTTPRRARAPEESETAACAGRAYRELMGAQKGWPETWDSDRRDGVDTRDRDEAR